MNGARLTKRTGILKATRLTMRPVLDEKLLLLGRESQLDSRHFAISAEQRQPQLET